MAESIRSFPNGSAGGPDSLRPQHLKDLTSPSAEGAGVRLIQSLTAFINLVLQGETPLSVRHVFFGAILIPLGKKDTGVRPIAVGNTLRRLAAKCVSTKVAHSLGRSMAPHQLGCGTPLSCEAAAHDAHIYIQNLPPGHVMLKLNFQNAFNTLRRDKMLNTVRESAPSLYSFIHSAYEKPSTLFCGDCTIQSSEGIQQGDPLGPFLFCLTIHPMVKSVESEFRIFYLDDGTLGVKVNEVLWDLKLIEEEAAKLGLILNRHKSELICDEPLTRNEILEEAPGVQLVSFANAELLGAPIGGAQSTDNIIQGMAARLRLMGERLCLLQTQDALLLLQHSFAIPKVVHSQFIPLFCLASAQLLRWIAEEHPQ